MPWRAAAAALLLLLVGASPAAAAETPCAPPDCGALAPVFLQWDEARRLRYGYGMTGKAEQAIRWYRREAEAGDARAMHNLGLMLVLGLGAPPDAAEGRRWLLDSLAQGSSESALALGNLDRAADPVRAAAFYRFGALRGEARAMHAMGNLHMAGSGVPHSEAEAYFWYILAARRGHAAATAARDALAATLPAARRAEAEARAAAFEPGR